MNDTLQRLIMLTFFSLSIAADQPPKPEISIASKWESKYVSEGRNNLPDGGLATLEAAAAWINIALSTWIVTGTRENYQELQFTTEYSNAISNIEFYTAFTRLQFPADDASDNELSAGLAFAGLPDITPAIDYVFSTGASGGFLEISLSSEQPMLEGMLTATPYILQAFDFGYASESFNGYNNFQLGLEVAMPFNETFGLAGSVAHSIAMDDVEKENLGNVSWFTIGLTGSF
ncbi:MAG: hypothetical protein ACRBF0_23020 [Calditrichia bacterium]